MGALGEEPTGTNPAGLAVGVIPQSLEQAAVHDRRHLRIAELAMVGSRDAAAELLRHGLHAVADAEHGHAGVPHGLRRLRRLGVGHRLRPAGEDDAAGAEFADRRVGHVPGMDLAVDAAFADATRDELGVLRPEIEDQDAMRVDVGRSHRGRGLS